MSTKFVQLDPKKVSFPEAETNWDRALAEAAATLLSSFESAGHGAADLEVGVRAMHGDLERFSEYQNAMKIALAARPSFAEPWVWRPLLETEALRIGFLVLYRYGRMPLHDHPGASGAQLVIKGGVRIQQFQHQSGPEAYGGLRILELVLDREFREGEVASYKADTGNIHGLEAMQPSAVLFTVTVPPPYRGKERAWYYPLPLCPQKHPRFLVNRVARRIRSAQTLADYKAVGEAAYK